MSERFSVRLFQELNIYVAKASHVQVVYWIKGTGSVNINLNEYKAKSNDIFFIMFNDTYQICSEQDSLVLTIDISFRDYFNYANNYIHQSGYKLKSYEKSQIEEIICQIVLLISHNTYEYAQTKMIKHLCVELGALQHFKRVHHETEMTVLEEVHEYLIENHGERLKKQEIAQALKITQKQLSSIIKNQTPFKSINQYINDIRLKSCLVDIIKNKETVEEVAYKHGFKHYSRFINLFKAMYKQTPKMLRNSYESNFVSYSERVQELNISQDIFKLLIKDIEEEHETEMNIIQLDKYKKLKKIKATQVFIGNKELTYINEYLIQKAIHKLNPKLNTVNIIIEINLKEFDMTLYKLEYSLSKMINLGLIPIFHLKPEHHTQYDSEELYRLNQFLMLVSQLSQRFKNNVFKAIVNPCNKFKFFHLSLIINSIFDKAEIYMNLDYDFLHPILIKEIDHLITGYFYDFIDIRKWHFIRHKSIFMINHLEITNSDALDERNMIELNHLFNFYNEILGICLNLESFEQESYNQNEIMAFESYVIFISMLNQLKGNLVYQNNQVMVTKQNNEYQCLAIFLESTQKFENINLLFKSKKLISHAEANILNFNILKTYRNKQTVPILKKEVFSNKLWKGELSYQLLDKQSCLLSKMSIAHIKIQT